jgi:hypothetical protein
MPVANAISYVIQTRSDFHGQTNWRDWLMGDSSTEYTLYFPQSDPAYFTQPGVVYFWRVLAVGSQGNRGMPSGEGSFRMQWEKPRPDF